MDTLEDTRMRPELDLGDGGGGGGSDLPGAIEDEAFPWWVVSMEAPADLLH